MARKSTKPKPDADGILRTGIYQKYVGKPEPEHQLTADKAEAYVERLNSPATSDLGRIREWLAKIILPHVEGPISEAESMRPTGHTYGLDFGDGVKPYLEKPALEQQEQWVIDAFRDAVAALNEIRLIEMHLEPDGKSNWLFRATFRLGQLCERIGVRPFEPLAMSGRKATIERPTAMRDGKAKAAKRREITNRRRAEKALSTVGQKHPTAREDNKISFLKRKAAEHLEIDISTLNRWLRKGK